MKIVLKCLCFKWNLVKEACLLTRSVSHKQVHAFSLFPLLPIVTVCERSRQSIRPQQSYVSFPHSRKAYGRVVQLGGATVQNYGVWMGIKLHAVKRLLNLLFQTVSTALMDVHSGRLSIGTIIGYSFLFERQYRQNSLLLSSADDYLLMLTSFQNVCAI